MPRVPTYDNFQVAPTGLSGARVETPKLLDAAGQQAEQFGNAMLSAGRAVGTITTDIQDQVNRARVDDAATQAETARNQAQLEVAKLQGKQALDKDIHTQFTEQYGKTLSELRNGLANDAQKFAFDRYARTYQTDLSTKINAHIFEQQKLYDQEVQQGRQAVSTQSMSLNWNNPSAIAQGRTDIVESVKLQFKGAPEEFVAGKTIEALSGAHSGVLAQAIQQNNYGFAQQYLKEFGAELTPDARTRLEKAVQIGSTQVAGQSAAREVISGAGAEWSLKTVDEQLVARYGNDPETLRIARAEAAYQDQVRKETKNQAETQLLKPVQDALGTAVLQGNTVPRAQAEALLAPLKANAPELYLQAANLIDSQNNTVRARKQAADELAIKQAERFAKYGNSIETSTATFYSLRFDPEALRFANLDELRKQGYLGMDRFNELVKLKADLVSGKIKEDTLRSDADVVNMVLKKGADIDPKSNKLSDSELQKVVKFQALYDARVASEGGSSVVKQTRKVEIANDLLSDIVLDKGVMWDTTKRKMDVEYTDIDAVRVKQIENKFIQRGMIPTKQMVVDYFIRNGG